MLADMSAYSFCLSDLSVRTVSRQIGQREQCITVTWNNSVDGV